MTFKPTTEVYESKTRKELFAALFRDVFAQPPTDEETEEFAELVDMFAVMLKGGRVEMLQKWADIVAKPVDGDSEDDRNRYLSIRDSLYGCAEKILPIENTLG